MPDAAPPTTLAEIAVARLLMIEQADVLRTMVAAGFLYAGLASYIGSAAAALVHLDRLEAALLPSAGEGNGVYLGRA